MSMETDVVDRFRIAARWVSVIDPGQVRMREKRIDVLTPIRVRRSIDNALKPGMVGRLETLVGGDKPPVSHSQIRRGTGFQQQ